MNYENGMITIETKDGKLSVSKMIYHFIEFMREHGENVSDVTELINEFQSFLDYWKDFKESKKDATYNNKHLTRFNLFHTIKPKTEYAHQQEYKNGKPTLYPVYRISNKTVFSMACGGNYPLKDCKLFIGDGTKIESI